MPESGSDSSWQLEPTPFSQWPESHRSLRSRMKINAFEQHPKKRKLNHNWMPGFSSTRPSVTCMYPSHRNYPWRKHHPYCAGEETDSEAVYNPNPMSSLDHEALKKQITEPPSPFQTPQTSILTQRPPLHPGSKSLPWSTFETAELCPVSRATLTCLDLIRSPPALKKGHFLKKKNCFYWNSSEHQIYLVLVSKNRLYIWYWWCQNQTVTGHDGERW